MPSNRPIYDNQVPEVPSHWIPIYGSGHGIFYDPVTKLFYNDGPPRPTLERPDGTMQPMDDANPVPPIGFQPEDVLHLQPPSLTEPVARAMESNPHAIRRYYCRCRAAWLETPHGCPDEVGGEEHLGGPAPPIRATPGAIRPSDVLPPEYFTHDLAVGDLGYLTPQQRWGRFGYQRSQRMYGLAETVDTRPWIYSEGEGGGRVFEGASARNERGSSERRGAREQRAARNEARQSRGDYGH